jgi:hypothetical protein
MGLEPTVEALVLQTAAPQLHAELFSYAQISQSSCQGLSPGEWVS